MVQAAGKRPIDLTELDVDSASFSAHKIRGPQGSGTPLPEEGDCPCFTGAAGRNGD